MTKIKNFFKKTWNWIKKAFTVCKNYFRENVWAGVLAIVLGILLFIFIVQGIVKAIDKAANTEEDQTVLNATTLTSAQLMDKLSKGETFIIFFGANNCAHCKEFYKTINTYVGSGNTVYYLDLNDKSDTTLNRYYPELEERLLNDIPVDRGITAFNTPTTVYVKNGQFADAIQGAYGMEGGANYATFCDIVEGKYVGKPTYKLQ